MPPPERADLHQQAVLWPAVGVDAYGEAVVGEPVEIPVRWLDQQGEALDAQGNTITLDATAIVDRRIPIGSLLWLGTLADWVGTGSGLADTQRMYVKTSTETPDLKGRNARRSVGLMRFRDSG